MWHSQSIMYISSTSFPLLSFKHIKTKIMHELCLYANHALLLSIRTHQQLLIYSELAYSNGFPNDFHVAER